MPGRRTTCTSSTVGAGPVWPPAVQAAFRDVLDARHAVGRPRRRIVRALRSGELDLIAAAGNPDRHLAMASGELDSERTATPATAGSIARDHAK
jgi:hypothetical protein